MSNVFRTRAHILASPILLVGLSAGPTLAAAQEITDIELENVRAPQTATRFEAHQSGDSDCFFSRDYALDSAPLLGCETDDERLGLSVSHALDHDTFGFKTEVAALRSSRGPLSLDRQINGARPGLRQEDTSLDIRVEGRFLDDQLTSKSQITWNRSWLTPIATPVLADLRSREHDGYAFEQSIDAKLVSRPDFTWTVTGSYAQASDGYRPVSAAVFPSLGVWSGSEGKLRTNVRAGKWRFDLSQHFTANDFVSSDRYRLSVGRSGVTVRLGHRKSASGNNPGAQSDLTRNQIGLDLSVNAMMPSLMMRDDLVAWIVPDMITLEYADTTRTRLRNNVFAQAEERNIGLFGYWSTPLGDTILKIDRDTRSGGLLLTPGDGPSAKYSAFANHSFALGDWSIDLTYSSADFASVWSSASDGNSFASYSIGATRAEPGQPKYSLSIGRDNMVAQFGDGELQLRNRSLRAEGAIDFTPWIAVRTGRDDIKLSLDLRWDLDEDGYDFFILDELVDNDEFVTQSSGFLLNFRMDIR